MGAIIALGGDRTVFVFDDAYADDPAPLGVCLMMFPNEIMGLYRLHGGRTRLA